MSDLSTTRHVMTVTGPVAPKDLGITLAHEHLFIDLRNQFIESDDPEKQRVSRQPLGPENREAVRDNPYAILDNLVLDDVDLAVREVRAFAATGGRTIIDCTPIGINRSIRKLHDVAVKTGLNIVAGCGYYTHDTHPPQMDEWSAEAIAERLLKDLTEGIDNTSIKAGVIGEIGTSDPIHPNERKNLIAAALAFRHTQAAIQVHTHPWGRTGLEVIDLLTRHDVDPNKIVICHADVQLDLNYIRSLLKRGVFVEFDDFGKEFRIDRTHVFARDIERVRAIRRLLDEDYARQLLITTDVCLKGMLHHYGGLGYDHILTGIVPLMQAENINPHTIDQFLVRNPQRLYRLNSR